ncbi:uncharacterized protein BX663DRAFT_464795 [Cokeromyces recurvatus]|uniref:uncharacterized protein n=1 Tax=Cokeromyces recurvatus TaxID=90255 RepID=UPI0022203A95|nr:uncharacterized protein BX663DRAFT_464795 [Cokeromyces recurvatus]KAI7908186.1 hypothetical protein BX663DRAFT_464795 [Cokeromyces recurvatus]
MSNNINLHIIEGKRILCTADVRGNISELNRLAREFNANYIIHTGDFGFYDRSSLERIGERPLKHWIQYTTLIPPQTRSRLLQQSESIYETLAQSPETLLSQFPDFLAGHRQLEVPVYTVWGACEDVAILEKFRQGEYRINNLFILDEASTHVLDIEGISLRLFGLGGAVVQHKLFDNGEGTDTIAGGLGVMWTTALQMGELVELAQSVYDPTETRVLVTHASPGREGLLAQLALTLQADFTISGGLHFRYNIAYNEFACQPELDHFRNRLIDSQQQFMQLWEVIRDQVEESVDDHQYTLLCHALNVVNRVPPSVEELEQANEHVNIKQQKDWERDELAFKNMWHFNLPDAAYGSLVFQIHQGVISSEMKSYGLNFSYRRNNNQQRQSPSSSSSSAVLDKSNTNIQQQQQQQQPVENTANIRKRQSMRNNNQLTAYVGGLSNTTMTEEDIREYFGHENITNVKFPIDPSTQLPKPHCYVEFSNQYALEQALAKNGTIYRDNRLIINRPNNTNRSGRSNRHSYYRDSRINY